MRTKKIIQNRKVLFLTALFLLWGAQGLVAVELFPGKPVSDLWKQASYLALDDETIPLEKVQEISFIPFTQRVPNFGFTDQTVWVRIDVNNQGQAPERWTLTYDFPMVDSLTFYLVKDGGISKVYYTGDSLPFYSRPLPNRNFLFPFALGAKEEAQIYLKIRSRDTLEIPLRLLGPQELFSIRHQSQLGLGIFFGVAFVMIAFNCCIFLISRDTTYLFYVAYALSFTLFIGTLYGLSFEYLWPDWPWWNKQSRPVLIGLTIIFIGLFIKQLLIPQESHPRLNKTLSGLMILGGLNSAIALMGLFSFAIRFGILLSVAAAVVACLLGVVRFRDGYRPARFFLYGWSVLLVSIILYCLKAVGLIEPGFWVDNGMLFGAAIEVTLLSLAMADHLKVLENDQVEVQRESERQQKKWILQLKASDRVKTEFLHNMSHELRTPLNGLIGMANLLKGTSLSSEQQELTGVIDSSSRALLRIIGDVLELSKVQQGVLRLQEHEFDLSQVLQDQQSLFTPAALEKGLQLELKGDGLPERLYGDSHKLSQVLSNLLSNAVKFTQVGSVELQAKATARSSNSWLVEIVVQDSGIGMDEQVLAKIFRPFVQGDTSSTKIFSGIGLGLSVAKELTNLLAGHLQVKSQPGTGTRVTLSVEFSAVSERPADVPMMLAEPTAGSIDIPRVILAETDHINRITMERWMQGWGIDVHCCSTPEELEEALLEQDEVQLLLIEQGWAGDMKTGAIERIKQAGYQGAIALIMTLASDSHTELSYPPDSIDGVIQKPICKPVLQQTLQYLLGMGHQQAPPNNPS